MSLDREQIAEKIAQLGPWFHNLELRGIPTAPAHFLGDFPRSKFARFGHVVPTDLRGMTVLDIGCNGGFYSIEMKRRGADRVVAIDADPAYLEQARFAAAVEEVDIEFRQLDVYDVEALGEKFDLVLFLGVLYHLRHPLLALDRVHEHVVRDTMIFQSLQRGSTAVAEVAENYPFEETALFDEPSYPKMHFVEKRYADDPTNWWIPNRACAEAMLRSAGFVITANPELDVYVCKRGNTP